jgi:hypothetical protein
MEMQTCKPVELDYFVALLAMGCTIELYRHVELARFVQFVGNAETKE